MEFGSLTPVLSEGGEEIDDVGMVSQWWVMVSEGLGNASWMVGQ